MNKPRAQPLPLPPGTCLDFSRAHVRFFLRRPCEQAAGTGIVSPPPWYMRCFFSRIKFISAWPLLVDFHFLCFSLCVDVFVLRLLPTRSVNEETSTRYDMLLFFLFARCHRRNNCLHSFVDVHPGSLHRKQIVHIYRMTHL